ncbi:circadian clock KaiB family protein [uncultured Brevundimonas sp.]|uniref:circadian clock KaiB family protein n=1 Tax=uncultured Brevundimonas sp. TaxID=213418 RepID=UPI0030ECEA03|tara:strand:+ start:1734 stop:2057 length:324 start_codon:yes stop_codon:yes gene_type:complete
MMLDPQPPPAAEYALRLYVTGTTMRSVKAITNLRQVCEERLEGRYELEVIDIYQEPGAAADHQILAAPTLVKMTPLPMRRIIGDLSDRGRLLAGLGLEALPEIGGEH